MYSWYMPKDEPNSLLGALGVGHRHDWENAVVVLTSESTDATLVGMAASYHGDYNVCVGSGCDDYLDGTNPLIMYYSEALILDHSLGFTTTVGGTQPLIAWDELPTVAQDALTDKDWGGMCFIISLLLMSISSVTKRMKKKKLTCLLDAIVAFLDSDFESYLAEAYGYLDI